MEIRKLSTLDIELVKALQPDDWSDITPYFQYYLLQPQCHPFVFRENGRTIGIGNINICNGQAWLSHIIVRTECRNQGKGGAITEALLDECKKHHCRQVHLVATAMGEPVYRKLGFKPVCQYLFLKAESFIYKESETLQAINQDDEAAILALDHEVTGEDRAYLFKEKMRGFAVKTNNKIRGFYLPEIWDGPVIARDPEAGISLLALHLKEKKFVVLPEKNEAAIKFLYDNGAKEFHTPGMRMVFGNELSWKPENIYGRIAGAFG
jgi:N-acetylglutamate synthase-like GNAT family acetyltransferase